jgi:O-acetylserine/cysteine efflux transporter
MKPLDALAAAAIVLVWSLNYSVNKYAVGHLPPLLLLTGRHLLVAVVLAPFLKPLGPRWRDVLVIATVFGALHFALFFCGLPGVGAGLAAVVNQLQVPIAALLARLLLREPLGPMQLAGMATALAGVYLVAGQPEVAASPLHLALIVAAAVAFGLGNILVRRLGPIEPLWLTAWVSVLAAPQLLVATLIFETGQLTALGAANWSAWAAVAFTGLTGAVGAYSLWYRLLGRYPVGLVTSLTLLLPGGALILASLLLGEPVTAGILGGAAVAVVGVAMIQFGRPRQRGART